MLRRLVGALSLTALVASGATAQQFTQNFTFEGGGPVSYNYLGGFAPGGNIGLTGELPDSNTVTHTPIPANFFQVWCVDPLQYVSGGNLYPNATVTPLNSTLSSFLITDAMRSESNHTNPPATTVGEQAAEKEYQKAAYLALQMDLQAPSYTDWKAIQAAIWIVMGYDDSNLSLLGWGVLGVTSADITKANTFITNMNNATTNSTNGYNSIVLNDWAVITGPSDKQEFIYERQTGTFLQVTPEPATISMLAMGLVGVAGNSVRRRRQRKA